MRRMLWDIFCRVIDNYGDIGVTWRLSAQLARRGELVRLWVDDASALDWMAPGALQGRWHGITVLPWELARSHPVEAAQPAADVWVEMFGCEVPTEFIRTRTHTEPLGMTKPPVWINLEYLSAEAYVERSHLLASPVMQGPAKGWTKTFFYPGFGDRTGGVLRGLDVPAKLPTPSATQERLAALGVAWRDERLVSLFCYEPPALAQLFHQLEHGERPTLLLVTAGRAAAAVRALWGTMHEHKKLRLHYLPSLTQNDYDALLMHADLNFVRGEDSLVRAVWAGKPFVWNIYPQHDGAHLAKLEAFLDLLNPPHSVRLFHQAWNQRHMDAPSHAPPCPLPLGDLGLWTESVLDLRSRLMEQDELASQLLGWVHKNR
jgi:uncharacterized repeat protein (TIGR03837 family)